MLQLYFNVEHSVRPSVQVVFKKMPKKVNKPLPPPKKKNNNNNNNKQMNTQENKQNKTKNINIKKERNIFGVENVY